jgi:predicted MPP superfamily phosphohydrolase
MSFISKTVAVLIASLLVEFYFSYKIVSSLKQVFNNVSRKEINKDVAFAFLFFNLFLIYLLVLQIYRSITGNPFPPLHQSAFFNYLIEYPFWLFFLLAIQCFLFFIILQILKPISIFLFKKRKEKIKTYEARLVLIITVFFILYIPGRVIFDYNTISTRVVKYKKNDLPENLQNFKITFISDIHADYYTDSRRLQKFINDVNGTNPDLVLVGGDMISSGSQYIDTAAVYLGKIKSKYGIYSCVGDHDFWAYGNDYSRSLSEITDALGKQNIKMIDNGNEKINVDSTIIGITFITNAYVRTTPNYIVDSLSAKLDDPVLKILVTHQPKSSTINEGAKDGYDLLLAGHTHGGQITFLFPFKNLTPTMIETSYIKGDFQIGKMFMIVTRGLGMSIIPMRYNSTPEVTSIVLQNK